MKLHRLLAITMLLLSRKRMSGQELAERFEVSLRTIYRDLEAINAAGIPIASFAGADGGYEIMEQYHIDRQMVTLDELRSILTALKGFQASLDDRETDRLLAKVGALVARSERNRAEGPGETLLIDTDLWRGGQEEKELLSELRQAAISRSLVTFAYTDAGGQAGLRSVEPIGVAWKNYAWYLYAFCRLRQDYRTFKLNRIKDSRIESEVFDRRGITLEELNARWNGRTGETFPLVLRFSVAQRQRVEELFGTGGISSVQEGMLLLKKEQLRTSWLLGVLFNLADDVEVLEPKELILALREKAERICRLYQT
ncbi:YafY family protein [Paenibacillus filicis]|uniref:YafY family protein n=1 Tax=Paenibacillus filicis TaxID=669464 RepID=A0ABU9DBW1_9BACL